MISRQPWGSAGGQPVELFTLSSGGGATVAVATYGGVVQSLRVPDRAGRTVNVALGFDGLDGYLDPDAADAYFGAIIGRCANRIAGHSFVLDGRRHELAHAPGDSVTLHGGPGAYHTQVWQAAPARVGGGDALRLSYVDPDGRNGFPGTVRNEVVYALTPDNALRIEYQVACEAPTVVNLTNHTYFNLGGEGAGDVYSQLLAVNSSVFQPVDETQVPVGFAGVSGTPFDFRTMKPLGRDIRSVDQPWGEQLALGGGYDHNWVLPGAGYRLVAVAWDPGTGIVLWTYTDQPGLQVYTGNHLTGELVGSGGRAYREGGGFALETQRFPDAPNHIGEPGWPSVVLRPGEVLRTRTTYKFAVAGPELADRIRF